MPDIRDTNYEIKYYYTDPCTKESCCIEKETILNFEDFDPIYAPVFVDMLITAHKTLKNVVTEELEKKNNYKYYIHLKYPMDVGTIIGSDELKRKYWLFEYKGRSKKGSFIYRIKSIENISFNEMDEVELKKDTVVYKKGQYKNITCE